MNLRTKLLSGVSALALMTGLSACADKDKDTNTTVVTTDPDSHETADALAAAKAANDAKAAEAAKK